MNINKILKIATYFEKIAQGVLSAEEIKNIFDNSIFIKDFFFKVYDLVLFLYKDLESIKPTNWSDAQQTINRLKNWELNILQPYLDVIENINLSDGNIKNVLGPDEEFASLSEVYLAFKYKIPELKKIIQNKISYCKDILNVHYYGGKLYIRFGKYPKSERSRMGLGDEWEKELGGKKTENGVSVYRARAEGNKFALIDSNPNKAIYQYHGFNPTIFADSINSGDIYLVTGKQLEQTGSDGEPLLKDIFPIRKLSPDEIVLDTNTSISLTDVLKKYNIDEFEGFKESKTDRELALGIPLLKSIVEHNVAESDEEDEWLSTKLWGDTLIKNLPEEDKSRLLSIIRRERKKKNKKLVFKGFRPFY